MERRVAGAAAAVVHGQAHLRRVPNRPRPDALVPSISILSRDPNLFRKLSKHPGKPIEFFEKKDG